MAGREAPNQGGGHIETLRERHQEFPGASGRSPASLRLDIKTVASVFTHGVRQGVIANNPVGPVELDDAAGSEKEPFSEAEINALLAAASSDWKTAILQFAEIRFLRATTAILLLTAIPALGDTALVEMKQ